MPEHAARQRVVHWDAQAGTPCCAGFIPGDGGTTRLPWVSQEKAAVTCNLMAKHFLQGPFQWLLLKQGFWCLILSLLKQMHS